MSAYLTCRETWAECRCGEPADAFHHVHTCPCGGAWTGTGAFHASVVLPPEDGGTLLDLRPLIDARREAARRDRSAFLWERYAAGLVQTPPKFSVVDVGPVC